jgi:hypothetical protein
MNWLAAAQKEMQARPEGVKREAQRLAKIELLNLTPEADETAIAYAETEKTPDSYLARVFERQLRAFLEKDKGMSSKEAADYMNRRLLGVQYDTTFANVPGLTR